MSDARKVSCCVLFPLIVALAARAATPEQDGASPRPSAKAERAAWQWSDEERLKVRFDPVSIRERSSREATEPYGVQPPNVVRGTSKTTQSVDATAGNLIVGRRNPELLMPFELFNLLIEQGFTGDAAARAEFRKSVAPQIEATAIAPDTFWSAVERAAAPFIRNQQQERELLAQLNEAKTDEARTAIRQQLKNLQQPQCQQRAAALEAVTKRLGRSVVYRVLYEGIAPSLNVTSVEPDTPARLQFVAGGCR